MNHTQVKHPKENNSEYDYMLRLSNESIQRFEQKKKRQESQRKSYPAIKSYYRVAN